jgi:hypothetical protein
MAVIYAETARRMAVRAAEKKKTGALISACPLLRQSGNYRELS